MQRDPTDRRHPDDHITATIPTDDPPAPETNSGHDTDTVGELGPELADCVLSEGAKSMCLTDGAMYKM